MGSVSDHLKIGLRRQIRVAVEVVSKQSTRQPQQLRDGVNEPRKSNLRRRRGVFPGRALIDSTFSVSPPVLWRPEAA